MRESSSLHSWSFFVVLFHLIYLISFLQLKNTNTLQLSSIPEGVREEVRLLLHATPQLRPDALQFSKVCGVKSLSSLSTFSSSIKQYTNFKSSYNLSIVLQMFR